MNKAIAVVSGASSGIGSAIARLLSQNGWAVVLLGRDASRLKTLCSSLDGPTNHLALDLRSPQLATELDSLLSHGDWAKWPVNALVNNAGIFRPGLFAQTDLSNWLEQFEVNLFGSVRLTQILLPRMGDGSSIVNVSSTLGLRPIPNTSAYSASKAAMNNWTQGLALELAPRVRVNCVCPGLVDTPIHGFHAHDESSSARQSAHQSQPMKRMGKPEDIAQMVEFLVSDRSAWTTGSVISVDGGIGLL